MKIETNQKSMPKSGQFVVVWEYNGKIWAETTKVSKGKVKIYDVRKDKWFEPFGAFDDSQILTIIKPS
jgi:hypothetical protein